MSCVLELQNIGFTYGLGTPFEKRAVDGVSLKIEKGEFIGVIGHTGSGKSTLVQMLNGLIRPTDGRVLLNGRDIWEQPKKIRDVRFRVGMVFQYPEYQLFEETVNHPLICRAVKSAESLSQALSPWIPTFWCSTSPRQDLTPWDARYCSVRS